MFKIGYRTAKTALGTTVAVMFAQYLQLDNYISAGILTILCIRVTKRQSIQSSWQRFIACIMAIFFSYIFFEGVLYHPIVIGIMLLFFIPTTVLVKVTEGIVTSTVIIFHLYNSGGITYKVIVNELLIILIGIGVALIMNLYMPSAERKLKYYLQQIEENLATIFHEIELYLLDSERNWDGKEITKTAELIDEAKSIAYREIENHFIRSEDTYFNYFKMREKQFEIVERIIPLVTSIQTSVDQSEMIADFIRDIHHNIHPGNTAHMFLRQLYKMRQSFQEMELPKTREEFEARAALLHFVNEMEQYLIIKSKYKGMLT
jgi:uncharacterized membrane protein YgaE (UPF0421/DUF939 family)